MATRQAAFRDPPSPRSPSRHPLAAECREGLPAITERAWDALVPPGAGPLRYGFLTAWEQVELPGLRARPVAATDEKGALVGAAPGYWYDLDLLGTRLSGVTEVVERLRHKWPGLLWARTYELGDPTPLTNPFLVREEHRRRDVVSALAGAALAEAERGRAELVLVQNLATLDAPAAELLSPHGFTGIPILPTVVVDLAYASFEEYLGAMRSSYRRRAHQTLKRSGTLTVELRHDFAEVADELAVLWHLVYERATELRRERLTPAYFRALSRLEETSVLLLRRPGGSVASFALLFSERPFLAFLQCGFDVESGRSEGAYFRLLYEIVRVGIEQGFAQVDLGMTTVAPKLDVGGVPIALYALLRHRNPVLHRLITAFAKGPMGPGPIEGRHVFKDACPTAQEILDRRALLGKAAGTEDCP